MNKQITITTVALATILSASVAQAEGRDRFYDKARVLSVTPIVETVSVVTPRQQCWEERVQNRRRHSGNNSYTGVILGTIVGGAIGNNFGKGGGKDAMTIAGALLGASIGNDLGHNSTRQSTRRYTPQTTMERRCRTVEEVHEENQTVGYRVQYKYSGHSYWTTMDNHPGRYVRVRIQVSLAE